MTRRAFAFRFAPSDAASMLSTGFQVRTHRAFRSCPSGIRLHKMRRMVLVESHCDSSLSLALSNWITSSGVRSFIFTSTLCLLAAEAMKISCSRRFLTKHCFQSSMVNAISQTTPLGCASSFTATSVDCPHWCFTPTSPSSSPSEPRTLLFQQPP